MLTVDVAVIGGGPAGATCAGALVSAGFEVLVADQAHFPRDKVCAGWITPEVVRLLSLDLQAYAATHVLDPITAFSVRLGDQQPVLVRYGRAVSYGVRRVEFDDVLLQRARPSVVAQARVEALERRGGRWIVNGEWAARYLVGAGGHRCPVARALNPAARREAVVVAQRAEGAFTVEGLRPGTPELVFETDLRGYGWVIPKGPWTNIGLGRDDAQRLPAHVGGFVGRLSAEGRLRDPQALEWAGHAYLLAPASHRRAVGDRAVLVGDAAGLAAPGSGEGIRAAVLSGQMAADAIRRHAHDRDPLALARYADGLRTTCGHGDVTAGRRTTAARWGSLMALAFRSSTVVRRLVLNPVFLHGRPS